MAQYYTVLKYGLSRPQKDLNFQDRIIAAGPGMHPSPIVFSQVTENKKMRM